LEFRLLNSSTAFYMNGTQIAGSFTNGVIGGTLQSYSLSSSPIGEIYVDAISVSENGSVGYSDGFESGLTNLHVIRSGAATVDTVYFGQGVGLSSTVISLIPGLCCGELFEATMGSKFRIEGTVQNATSLNAVPSALILVDASYDSGHSFQLVGSVASDQNGQFSVYWTPSKVGPATLRAAYSGDCCFFGDITTIKGEISQAISRVSLSLSSSTSLVGFSVGIRGFLAGIDSSPISSANILLEFTVPAASGWTTITSAATGSDGNYQATWLPQATGTFTIKASWAGNGTYQQTSKTAILTSTSDGKEYVFSVASNATVSSTYLPGAKTVSFTAKGTRGSAGNIDVTLPKALISDISKVKVLVNGTYASIQVTQSADAVRIHFELLFHSSYSVEVDFSGASSQTSSAYDLFPYALYAGTAAVVLFSIVIGLRQRQKKLGRLKPFTFTRKTDWQGERLGSMV
jgi:hypothetical protein